MQILWILILLVPFLVSILGVAALMLTMVIYKRYAVGNFFALLLLSAIAVYLFRLILKSFRPEGGMLSDDDGRADGEFKYSWGGKGAGVWTIITYMILGPAAPFLFNKGKFPSFRHRRLDLKTRKFTTWMFLGFTYLALGMGALVLSGRIDLAVWIFAGFIAVSILSRWLAIIIGSWSGKFNTNKPPL